MNKFTKWCHSINSWNRKIWPSYITQKTQSLESGE